MIRKFVSESTWDPILLALCDTHHHGAQQRMQVVGVMGQFRQRSFPQLSVLFTASRQEFTPAKLVVKYMGHALRYHAYLASS